MLLGRPSRWPRSAGPPRGLLVPLARIRTPSLPLLPPSFPPRCHDDRPTRRCGACSSWWRTGEPDRCEHRCFTEWRPGAETGEIFKRGRSVLHNPLSRFHRGWKIELSSSVRPIPYHPLHLDWNGKAHDVNAMLLQPAK